MDIDPAALEASLHRLAGRANDAAGDRGLLPALRETIQACVDLFGVTGSGVMLADETNMIRYVAASDGQGRLLERLEAETMQGPCTDAYVHDRTVWTRDLPEDDRWPVLRDAVRGQDELRAVLGVPVKLGAIPVGTLDVFVDRPHEWTDSERHALLRYSGVVQAVLDSALTAHTAGKQAAQLQYALDYRVVIERGIGYLMARDGLDAVEAFNSLRSVARSNRTKIGQVAQHLLDTGRLPATS
jgi:transcriptional regulator with GAF, ATPase, and Fis domain